MDNEGHDMKMNELKAFRTEHTSPCQIQHFCLGAYDQLLASRPVTKAVALKHERKVILYQLGFIRYASNPKEKSRKNKNESTKDTESRREK
jgi:hypothetical protein